MKKHTRKLKFSLASTTVSVTVNKDHNSKSQFFLTYKKYKKLHRINLTTYICVRTNIRK